MTPRSYLAQTEDKHQNLPFYKSYLMLVFEIIHSSIHNLMLQTK